jgi:hypothetical protein
MRYNELLIESAASELAEKLPTLSHHTYNSIDKLMQHISARHKITGKKLHDLFVHKYGHTPDVWIKKLKHKLGEENTTGNKVFQSMSSQLLSIGKDADKIKKHDPTDIKNAIVKKLNDINDPKLSSVTKRFLQKVVEFNRSNPKTMAAIFGFTFAVIARTSMQVSHNLGLTPTQATLILEATLPTLGNFLGYLVNGFSVKDSIQSGLIAGAIGVGGTIAASGALNELKDTEKEIEEAWSQKYKNSINCSHPKGFSQKAHCAGKKKHNESVESKVMEMVCEDCGMCETHGDHTRDTLDEACWKGYHKEGMKTMFGKQYPDCRKNKTKNEGVAEGSETITELRDKMYQYIKSIVPTWPDYVVQDWLYKGRGKNKNYNVNSNVKGEILEMIADAGLSPNTNPWQLVPNLKFTMDMFEPKSKQKLIGRAGGTSDMGMGIPKDAERHATQAALIQRGGVSKEPAILIKFGTGYELLEGWHRTIQHFAKYPDGYTGPAYVAVAQGQQGVAEGWKSNLAGAAMIGLGALGGAGHAQAADLSNYNTQYLQQVVSGETPRPMVSIDDAKAELQARANGKQQSASPAAQPDAPKGYSKEYLQKAADPNRFGRYWISVEKAQELLSKMDSGNESFDSGSYANNKRGYAGQGSYTSQRSDQGYNIGENWELAKAEAIARLIESQLK